MALKDLPPVPGSLFEAFLVCLQAWSEGLPLVQESRVAALVVELLAAPLVVELESEVKVQ